MRIALGALIMALAGFLIWLLLVEAANTERLVGWWLVRVAGLAALILLILLLSAFLMVGGPMIAIIPT